MEIYEPTEHINTYVNYHTVRDVLLKKQYTPYNRDGSRIAPVNYNFTILRIITNGIFVKDKDDKLFKKMSGDKRDSNLYHAANTWWCCHISTFFFLIFSILPTGQTCVIIPYIIHFSLLDKERSTELWASYNRRHYVQTNKRTENVRRNMLRVYSMYISDVKQTDIECKYYC